MTAQEKHKFIANLTDSIRTELLGKVSQMPEEWDGMELRELLADKFDRERHMSANAAQRARFRRRLSAYRNEVATTTL